MPNNIQVKDKKGDLLDQLKQEAEQERGKLLENLRKEAESASKFPDTLTLNFKCSKTNKDWMVILNAKKNSNGLFAIQKIDTPTIIRSASRTDSSASPKMIDIQFDEIENFSNVKCPYCGNSSLIRCSCGGISCQGSVRERGSSSIFQCPWCGCEGIISTTTFDTLRGQQNERSSIGYRKAESNDKKPIVRRDYKALPP